MWLGGSLREIGLTLYLEDVSCWYGVEFGVLRPRNVYSTVRKFGSGASLGLRLLRRERNAFKPEHRVERHNIGALWWSSHLSWHVKEQARMMRTIGNGRKAGGRQRGN